MAPKTLLILACVLVATSSFTPCVLAKPKGPKLPKSPPGTVVAVAKLSAAPNKTTSGKGYLNLFLVRPDIGPSYFNLILEGKILTRVVTATQGRRRTSLDPPQ